MARKRMVTRTITATVASLTCADTENDEVFKTTITISGSFKDKNAVLKKAQKMMDSDTQKVLKVTDTQETTQLYGMTEEEFIANAHPINK